MKLLIDANILIAVLNKQYPLFSNAAKVLSLADNKRFQLFTTPVCLAISFYFTEKKSGRKLAKKKIALLTDKLLIAEHKKEDIANALANPAVEDLEDGMEYYTALRTGCNYIITENKEDFHFSSIEILDCDGLLKRLINQ